MSKLYKVLNRKDCAELGLSYSPLDCITLAEYNGGHYTLTRRASTLGKITVVILLPIFLIWYTVRGALGGVRECFCAVHDTLEQCDRRDFWGDDNKYIHYLKNKY